MRAIYVPLQPGMHHALMDLAARESLDPRDMAARLILEGLREAGTFCEEAVSACVFYNVTGVAGIGYGGPFFTDARAAMEDVMVVLPTEDDEDGPV